MRRDLALAERARRLADQFLIGGEGKVHRARSSHKKNRGAGDAFVHLSDRPIRACALHSCSGGFDLLALRALRERKSAICASAPQGPRDAKSVLFARIPALRSMHEPGSADDDALPRAGDRRRPVRGPLADSGDCPVLASIRG